MCLSLFALLFEPLHVLAQGSFAMTVTPPLFQVALQPGEEWRSSIRVVNNNPYDIDVYATPVGFQPTGERGEGRFIPLLEGTSPANADLAGWIEVSDDPVHVPREQTVDIPFMVKVPEHAPPGGHYAAIMVTNRPPEAGEGNQVSVASSIASLVFLRVAGDVIENGRIRDFYTEKYLYQTPESQFTLRFENLGNVHILPQGGITIYNMWGKERGYIPINTEDSNFGNVLPESVRKFTFTWKGNLGLYDIGRYQAVATLAYGMDVRQNTTSTAYFWVVPVWTTLKILVALALFIAFFFWAIRAYIRRALALEAAQLGALTPGKAPSSSKQSRKIATRRAHVEHAPQLRTLVRPIEAGAVDLRRLAAAKPTHIARVTKDASTTRRSSVPDAKPLTMGQFMRKYWLFFAFLVVVSICLMSLSSFFSDVLTNEREYEVTIEREDGQQTLIRSTVSEDTN